MRLLRVTRGGVLGVGKATTFIPVEAISRVTGTEVHVSVSRQKVSEAPVCDPDVVGDQSYYETLYGLAPELPGGAATTDP